MAEDQEDTVQGAEKSVHRYALVVLCISLMMLNVHADGSG